MYGNRDKTLGQRLDDLATGSGLYAVTMIDRPEPRNLRFVPLLILVAMVWGYTLTCLSFDGLGHGPWGPRVALGMLGPLLLFGGFTAAIWVRFLGPRITPDSKTALDERELMLKARAGSFSGKIITVLAIAGCFYFGYAQAFGGWMPHRITDWMYLALMIEGWAFTLPVLAASWLQPAAIDDE